MYYKYLLFVVLAGCQLYLITAQDKEGFCPTPTGLAAGPCPFACRNDTSCLLNRKCCPTRCGGTACVAPVTTEPAATQAPNVSEVSTKAGTCPGPYYEKDQCGLTQVAVCTRDSNCLGTQKCCSNGCVMTCRFPEATKSGDCPNNAISQLTPCIRKVCVADSDCLGPNQKCCNDGCRCASTRGAGALLSGLTGALGGGLGGGGLLGNLGAGNGTLLSTITGGLAGGR